MKKHNETEFQKIIRKTGRKPVSCKCESCKDQCRTQSCLGTPQDIEKIIDAGFGDRILPTDWDAGIRYGRPRIVMYQAGRHGQKACPFFINGLCELHDKGLKPTEGKLSHHSTKIDNWTFKKGLAMNVAKTWLDPANKEIIERIKQKI